MFTTGPTGPEPSLRAVAPTGRHRRDTTSGRVTLHLDPAPRGEVPVVRIDGHAVTVTGPRTVLEAPAGAVRVEVALLSRRGSTWVDLDLSDGGSVVLRWRAPGLVRRAGRLAVVAERGRRLRPAA